jgi:hypothetical protein
MMFEKAGVSPVAHFRVVDALSFQDLDTVLTVRSTEYRVGVSLFCSVYEDEDE